MNERWAKELRELADRLETCGVEFRRVTGSINLFGVEDIEQLRMAAAIYGDVEFTVVRSGSHTWLRDANTDEICLVKTLHYPEGLLEVVKTEVQTNVVRTVSDDVSLLFPGQEQSHEAVSRA